MVKKPADIFKIMHRTKQNRHSAETLCNRASSRSHAVFTINVTLTKRAPSGGLITKRGRLHLVDLSGSESIKRSGAEGIHATEAAVIGKSLLSLGRVIRSLVAKDNHVPYRESKLTRILSDSLGGSSYTALILAITPNSEMVGETMSTLSYGMLARNVTNTPKSDVTLVKKKVKKKDAQGNIIEGEEDEEGELIDDDGLDEDGGLKTLHGKTLSEFVSVTRAPWKASVPIRVRQPGERDATGERVRARAKRAQLNALPAPVLPVTSPAAIRAEGWSWRRKRVTEGDVGGRPPEPPLHMAGLDALTPPPLQVPIGNVNSTPRVFHGETVEWAKLILSEDKLSLSTPAKQAFVEIFNRFDYNRTGSLNREQIQAMDYVVGEGSTSPQAEEFLTRFWRMAKKANVGGGGSE
jgi:hypothetical protein